MNSIKILNQRVDSVSQNEVYTLIKKSVENKEKNLFFALNIHILTQLHQNQKLKKIHNKFAKVIFADGIPLLWFAKIKKKKLKGRVSGTELVQKILENKKLKVFILGSDEQTLKKAQEKFHSICDYYAPPFNDHWPIKEKDSIINKINKSKATIILVAIGPLKQEKWLLNNYQKINTHVGIGVGSAIDILVGNKPRAPKILRDNGFEWLWRILLEPRRLAVRYLRDFINIILIVMKDIIK